MSIKITKNIYDHSGKLLFNIPIDTILDKIPVELWIIMDRYNPDDIFVAIGAHSKEYPGYRLVCKNEFFNLKFRNKLDHLYRKNHGILSMDDLKRGKLSGKDCDFSEYVSYNTKTLIIKKNEYCKFYDEDYDTKRMRLSKSLSSLGVYYDKIPHNDNGLFVSEDYIFLDDVWND